MKTEPVNRTSTCCPHAISAGRLFSRFAVRSRKRFERKGFEASQRLLFRALLPLLPASSILEVGCGTGYFHQRLLQNGARTAIGIDLSPAMIEQARLGAQRRNLEDRVRYDCGDFVQISGRIEACDITVLDKVVCCYPDARTLLAHSVEKTRHSIAIIYPADRWFIRLAIALTGQVLRVLGSDFRPYFHSPERLAAMLAGEGFTRTYQDSTGFWLVQVYNKGV